MDKNKYKIMYLNVINKLEEKPNFILENSLKCKRYSQVLPKTTSRRKNKWNKASIYIHRLINASNKPYSGAYCFFKEKNDHLGFRNYTTRNINLCYPRSNHFYRKILLI